MFEYGFKQYDYKIVIAKGKIETIDDPVYQGHVRVDRDAVLTLQKNEVDGVRVEYKMMKPEKKWVDGKGAPDVVGNALVYLDDETSGLSPGLL